MPKGAVVRQEVLEPKRPTWVTVLVVAVGAALIAVYLLTKPAPLKQANADQAIPHQAARPFPVTTSEMQHAVSHNAKVLESVSNASATVADQVAMQVATAHFAAEKPAAEIIENALSGLLEASHESKPSAFSNPLAGWRRQFTEDVPDTTWSPMAEGQAQSYLAHRLGPDVELISVRCGSVVCEVQGASTSSNNSEKAANDWQSNMSAMSGESWWPTFQFATPNSAIWTSADGRALFVSYITRESQPAQAH